MTGESIDANRNRRRTEWLGKFDGKDYPIKGGSASITHALRKMNDRTLQFIVKKDGKVITTGQDIVSADGRTRTVTARGISPKKWKMVAVNDKQTASNPHEGSQVR